MIENRMEVHPGATGVQAGDAHFYGEQYIAPEVVPQDDLRASGPDFIEPSETAQWHEAQTALRRHGLVVLVDAIGSGREILGLRLLQTVVRPSSLYRLDPDWSKPKTRYLPQRPGQGGILDLSFATLELPDEDFGRHLIDYGAESLQRGQYTVVLSTPQLWEGSLARTTQKVTFQFGSPDPTTLITQDLKRRNRGERVDWLSERGVAAIISSRPRPSDALRLSEIISDSSDKEDLAAKLGEFTGWREYIEDRLLYPAEIKHAPDPLTTRTVLWSTALLDRAPDRAVVASSNLFLQHLGVKRTPAVLAQEPTLGKKMQAAHVPHENGAVNLSKDHAKLDLAVLRHLLKEFPEIRDQVLDWIEEVFTLGILPKGDVKQAMERVVHLACEHTETELLRTITTDLSEARRSIAIQVLTEAALSSGHGAYVRNQLYRWVKGKPSKNVLSLVTGICGGELGTRRPEIALIRLRLIAENDQHDSTELAKALANLARTESDLVFSTLRSWLSKAELQAAGRAAFLSLAGSSAGRTLLLGPNGERLHSAEDRTWLVQTWSRAVEGHDLQSPAGRAFAEWSELVSQGELPAETQQLLAEVFRREQDSMMYQYIAKDTPGSRGLLKFITATPNGEALSE
ncbi:hypothetical protein GCM10007079_30610 [Nocardiopsis terrae]|uniref:HEAT repeat-containing protein n=1 Tax=Nocardiopsis terrae TaxID=372655 RepID=A0ABR9HIR9_9ACTN|nr:hypothetical protein [Nocardiopsis terrae]MBE1458888.1 hypothetical protein [Nocardiopsis terrae]GHC86926.1 hypothetical protein GCM10007079_30610 [Nocardiopsis terrae]